MILDNIGKFEIGRKLENCPWSAPGFFNVGRSSATFRGSGITPVESDRLMTLVMTGRRVLKQPLYVIPVGDVTGIGAQDQARAPLRDKEWCPSLLDAPYRPKDVPMHRSQ